MGKDILVIGSTKHSRATCLQWRSPFPNIEDFEAVIVDMSSLDQSTYDHIYRNEMEKLQNFKSQLQVLFNTYRPIYCIFCGPLRPTRLDNEFKGVVDTDQPFFSSDFLPISVVIKTFSPSSAKTVMDHSFDTYFQGLDKWQFEIELPAILDIRAMPVAVNRSGKMIACRIIKFFPGMKKHPGIILLPSLTKYSPGEAIEILIDLILGSKKDAEYPWREQIEIPGLSKIQQEIDGYQDQIKRINERICKARERHRNRESYRDLFSVDDELQVKAVKRVLYDIGIDCDLTEPNFMVDLRGKQVAVEVTSTIDKIRQASDSLNQIGLFIETERKGEKVILVANTYKRLPLQERRKREDFTEQAAKYLEASEVCFMTARFLYLLWRKVEEKRMSARDARSLLLKTSTELTDGMI